MKVQLDVTNPEQVEFTLTATMTLAEWTEVRKRLKSGSYVHGIHAFEGAISLVIYQVSRTFRPETPEEDEG